MNIPKTEHAVPKAGIFAKKLPLLLVILPLLVVGCTTTKTYVAYDGPCPLRPELEPIPVEMQVEIAPYVVRIIAENQLKLKQHIKLLEAVSGCKRQP